MAKRSPRILLYTGKGGVGKTSVAAAAALRCADAGLRTVVLSTDTAHSLGDSLDVLLGPVPKPVVDNLWAQECDVYYNLETYWGTVQTWVEAVLTWRGMDNVMAEEIAVFPGMEELANLLWVNRHAASDEYDVVVWTARPPVRRCVCWRSRRLAAGGWTSSCPSTAIWPAWCGPWPAA